MSGSQHKAFEGIWTALITPFDAQGRIDFDALARILQSQIEAGVSGVIPCGTTGESPALSLAERKELVEFTQHTLKGTSLGVVAGTGSNSTASTIKFSRWASDQGVDGILVVTPYYNKPTQAGLKAHYLAVADAIDCELILYNVPGRTGVSLSPQTIVELAAQPKINCIKEASGSMPFSSEVIQLLRENQREMSLLTGDDATFLPHLSIGGRGNISVVANVIPREMVALYKAFREGRLNDAISLHQRIYPLLRDLFLESNPIPVKYAMSILGFCQPALRLPLVELGEASQQKLRRTLQALELLS